MFTCANVKTGKTINLLAQRGEIEPVTISWPGTSLEDIKCNSM